MAVDMAELTKPKAPVLKPIAPDANFVDDEDLQVCRQSMRGWSDGVNDSHSSVDRLRRAQRHA